MCQDSHFFIITTINRVFSPRNIEVANSCTKSRCIGSFCLLTKHRFSSESCQGADMYAHHFFPHNLVTCQFPPTSQLYQLVPDIYDGYQLWRLKVNTCFHPLRHTQPAIQVFLNGLRCLPFSTYINVQMSIATFTWLKSFRLEIPTSDLKALHKNIFTRTFFFFDMFEGVPSSWNISEKEEDVFYSWFEFG